MLGLVVRMSRWPAEGPRLREAENLSLPLNVLGGRARPLSDRAAGREIA